MCVYWCSLNRTKSAEDLIKLDKAVVLESMAVHQHNRNVGYEVQEEEHVTVLQRWRALTRGCCRGGRRRAVVHYPLGACDVPNHPPTNHPYIQWIFAAVPPLRDAHNAVPCNPVTGLMSCQPLDLDTPCRTAGLVQANANGSFFSSAKGVDQVPQVYPRQSAGGTCMNVCWDIDCPALDLNVSYFLFVLPGKPANTHP